MNFYHSSSISLLLVCSLSACSTPKTIYQWESYQSNVYEYFKNEDSSPEKQIASLEEGLVKIKANNGLTPPGYHAHLGLLYGKIGNADKFAQQLSIEKQLFPESTAYVNFLMKKDKK